MVWQRLRAREYSHVWRFDLIFGLTGDHLEVSSPQCSVGWWGCMWSGWPESRGFLELSRTVVPEFDCFRQDFNSFLAICLIMITHVEYMAGIYDTGIFSNIFVQTPPKNMIFMKWKIKTPSALTYSFRTSAECTGSWWGVNLWEPETLLRDQRVNISGWKWGQ